MNAVPNVPGLFIFPQYFSSSQRQNIVQGALALYESLKLIDSAELSAQIPQPDFVVSQKHNLTSREQYTRVQLSDRSGNELRGEYFPKYGEAGHSLCYLRGNDNLPDFAREILPQLNSTMVASKLSRRDDELKWKLTVNYYLALAGRVAGFPFHVDIPANGVVTMILNVHSTAQFEITNGTVTEQLSLTPGMLLVLSGDSRYQWKHRVLPKDCPTLDNAELERISLVLGFQ